MPGGTETITAESWRSRGRPRPIVVRERILPGFSDPNSVTTCIGPPSNANAHLPRRQVQVEARITGNAAAVRCSGWLGGLFACVVHDRRSVREPTPAFPSPTPHLVDTKFPRLFKLGL